MENSFIGKEVISKAFGKGVVEKQEGSTLLIRFYSGGNPKPFSYPRSFEKFLEFVDEDAKIESELALGEIETEENQRKEKALQEEIARKERLHKEAMKKSSAAGAAENFVVHSFSDVDSFCEGFRQDLYAEICFLKQNGGKRQKLVDGKLIEAKKGRYTYSFEADSELNYPENTMIKIWINNDSIPGMIAFCEDFTVTVITEINMGTDVASIEFSAEPWELIEGLRKRLEYIGTSCSEIVRDLVTKGKNRISYASKIVRGQDKALEMSLSQPITFIWGPPGTGKTETLSRIALEHLRKGKRVLMLSYSNVSVDGAILRVFKNDSSNRPGKLVRYGYSRDEFLNNHQYLTSFKLTLYNHPDLLKENISLRNELKTVKKASVRYI